MEQYSSSGMIKNGILKCTRNKKAVIKTSVIAVFILFFSVFSIYFLFIPFVSGDAALTSLLVQASPLENVWYNTLVFLGIIPITNANHLNSDRVVISDIYYYVNQTDNITYTIPKGQYVRAYFERDLTSGNVIDIYVINTQPATIEVYEKDSDIPIGKIENILEGKYYIYLNHTGSQAVFDLKSIGGGITYDYIHDQRPKLTITGANSPYEMCGEVSNYTEIYITSTGILNICPYVQATAGTGYLNISMGLYGNFTVDAGGVVNGSGAGAKGGAGYVGVSNTWLMSYQGDNSSRTVGIQSNNASGGGGGGAKRTATSLGSGGGGGAFGGAGGYGGNGSATASNYGGAGGVAYSSSTSLNLMMGSGGGGPNGDTATVSNGMAGGAGIKINASSGVIDIRGTINMSGFDGQSNSGTGDEGGGGGGSGGHIILIARNITVTNANLSVKGGGGGAAASASPGCGGGGAGGGRIALFYETLNNFSSNQRANISQGSLGANASCTVAATAGSIGTISYNALGGFLAPDLTNPQINITYPINNTNWSSSTRDVNYTVSDTDLQSCWYSNSSGKNNVTLQNCSTNITSKIWLEGINNVTIWVNDTTGNDNWTSVRFYVDTINPQINITYPINNTNWTTNSLTVNYTRSDNGGTGLGSCWYSNNSGKNNNTLASCGNITGVTWLEGINNVTVWVNDSAGNVNWSSVRFTVDTFYPIFSNYWDNNGSQFDGGTGYFNVTVINTNGSVYLTYNNTNYTATNSSGNATTFNFTITGLTTGTYSYNWSSYGTGSMHNFNTSDARRYTVNASAQCSPTIDTDWTIIDEQVCDGVEKTTGTGGIIITTTGSLYLINGANVSASGLNISSSGDKVFISRGSELRIT